MGTLFNVDATTGDVTATGSVTLTDQHPVVFNDTEGTPKSVSLQAPATVTTSYTLNLPVLQGTANSILQNDGSGNLSWTVGSIPAAGSTGDIQFNNGGIFAASNNLFWDNTTFRLGIGTATPAVSLEVNGQLQVDSFSHFKNNVFIDSGGALTVSGPIEAADGVQIEVNSGLYLFRSDGLDYIEFLVPNSTSTYTLTYPGSQGGANEAMINDGLGNLTWSQAIATTSSPTFASLTLSNKISSYNGDATVANGISSVIGNVALTGQTGNITTTTLFTPVTQGVYRVSFYMLTSHAGTAGTATTFINWVDEIQTQNFTSSSLSLSSLGAFVAQSIIIESLGGQPITYAVTLSGVSGSPTYNIYVVVERLS